MIETVREYLKQFGMDSRIRELNESTATVELAAAALGCEPARIAKSLTFMLKGEPVMVVASGNARVDNPKFKAQFGRKAKMLAPEDVEPLTGHAPGGVCPFANPAGARVYLDVSLRRFDAVYPACGSANSAIRLTCEELEKLSNSQGWIDVCKPKEPVNAG